MKAVAGKKWQPTRPTRYSHFSDEWPADRVRLTDAEARTLTPDELLDRIDFEQLWWERKCDLSKMSERDRDDYRQFRQLLHTYLPLADAFAAMEDLARGDQAAHDAYRNTPVGQRLERSPAPRTSDQPGCGR
jgi:hypothetical protein